MAALPLLGGMYSWQIEPFWLEFVSRSMVIPGLPGTLVGKKLMHISDIHVGNRFPRSYLIESFEKAQEYIPEIVVYTGDFVSYENGEQLDQLRKVMSSSVKGTIVTYAILGNHDYGANWSQPEVADEIVRVLENEGIQVLRNEKVEVGGLDIVGLDDFWGTNFNPESILDSIRTGNNAIILCHNPDVADENIWSGVNGYILAGHTHGGQVKPPFLDPPILPVKNQQYSAGLYDVGQNLQMYINRALGHLWQVRCNVRPEITIFTLLDSQ